MTRWHHVFQRSHHARCFVCGLNDQPKKAHTRLSYILAHFIHSTLYVYKTSWLCKTRKSKYFLIDMQGQWKGCWCDDQRIFIHMPVEPWRSQIWLIRKRAYFPTAQRILEDLYIYIYINWVQRPLEHWPDIFHTLKLTFAICPKVCHPEQLMSNRNSQFHHIVQPNVQ